MAKLRSNPHAQQGFAPRLILGALCLTGICQNPDRRSSAGSPRGSRTIGGTSGHNRPRLSCHGCHCWRTRDAGRHWLGHGNGGPGGIRGLLRRSTMTLQADLLEGFVIALQVGQFLPTVRSGEEEQGRPKYDKTDTHRDLVIGVLTLLSTRNLFGLRSDPGQLGTDLVAIERGELNGRNVGSTDAARRRCASRQCRRDQRADYAHAGGLHEHRRPPSRDRGPTMHNQSDIARRIV